MQGIHGGGEMNELEFFQWERASRDTLEFKKIYVDVADDLVAGIVLSEIIYWNLPAKDGTSKIRIEREGKSWIAIARKDWWDRVRVTPKQADRAIGILVKRGIVDKDLTMFSGKVTVHIHLNIKVLIQAIEEINQSGKSILPKGENRILPKVEIDIDLSAKSLTETTTENTAENTNIAPTARVPEPVIYPMPIETLHIPTASEIMQERTILAMQSRTPVLMDHSGLNVLDLSKFPNDVQPVIGKVCQLWKLKPPMGKDRAYWIQGGRELLDACGEFGPELLVIMRENYVDEMRKNSGIPRFTVSGPGSLTKTARSLAALQRDGSPEQVEEISGDSFFDTGNGRR
jgi:hypothetical protein